MMISVEVTSKHVISTDSRITKVQKTTKSGFVTTDMKDMTSEMDSASSN